MKKKILFGVMLSLSVALNVTFSTMLFVKKSESFSLGGKRQGAAIAERLYDLPDERREQVREVLRRDVPGIRDAAGEVKDARRQIFEYIKSEEYKREEAEARFAQLREKTSSLQLISQKMMLDIADELSPEQRTEFFKRKADGGSNLP